MTDLVVWSENPDQHGQTFGRAGRINMFIVGPDPDLGGFVVMTLGLFGPGKGMFDIGTTPHPDRAAAHRAAEDELVRILSDLDHITANLRAAG